jgi:hypothetical protein
MQHRIKDDLAQLLSITLKSCMLCAGSSMVSCAPTAANHRRACTRAEHTSVPSGHTDRALEAKQAIKSSLLPSMIRQYHSCCVQ